MPHLVMPASLEKLQSQWSSIPPNAHEPIIKDDFVSPLLEFLGFGKFEYYPEFPTGNGSDKVDFAAGYKANFRNNPKEPELLIEVKGRKTAAGAVINLAAGTPQYKQTKAQISKYLLAPKCKTAQWGLITNANHIQLFRRHGKVIFPATPNYLLNQHNFAEVITKIKELIANPARALSICVYNDKGGVGKTTTAINLAATLALKYNHNENSFDPHKKVLVIDFDPQQADLTASLGNFLQKAKIKLSDAMLNININIQDVIETYQVFLKSQNLELDIFDIIPSDLNLVELMDFDQQAKLQGGIVRLKKLIDPLSNNYDYIIFDCPTNWTFFSKSCVYASDVVLIPTQHDNFASLKNAKKVIQEFIPQMQIKKDNESPIALPIFFNNHKQTTPSINRTHNEIFLLLKKGEKGGKIVLDPDLTPFFYPKFSKGVPNLSVFTVPQYAVISSAGFSRKPAALTHKNAYNYYLNLAKEYFLE